MKSLYDAIAQIVERIVGRRLIARQPHPCTVVTQHGDGTLDVTPDSDLIPPMTKVPIRYGVPGVTAKVKKGGRVIVEFLNGDFERPVATIWESASVDLIEINATKVKLGAGARSVARRGDSVVVLITPAALTALSGGSASVPLAGYILDGDPDVTSGS